MTNDTALWALALSILTPLLTSVAVRPEWSRNRRVAVSAAVSVAVGVATAAATGHLSDGGDVLVAVGVVLVGAEAAYQKVWADSGVTTALEWFTSPKPGAAPGARQ